MPGIFDLLVEERIGVNVKSGNVRGDQKDRRLAIGTDVEVGRSPAEGPPEIAHRDCWPSPGAGQKHGLKSRGDIARII
ncbi:MAG: hypothetical protein ACXVJ0_13135 [Candidatus Angelobacter sp.]